MKLEQKLNKMNLHTAENTKSMTLKFAGFQFVYIQVL